MFPSLPLCRGDCKIGGISSLHVWEGQEDTEKKQQGLAPLSRYHSSTKQRWLPSLRVLALAGFRCDQSHRSGILNPVFQILLFFFATFCFYIIAEKIVRFLFLGVFFLAKMPSLVPLPGCSLGPPPTPPSPHP